MFRDNWVRFGFGRHLKPFSARLPFVIDYSAARPHPTCNDPLFLAQDACRHIRDSFPGPLTLMVSGGVDSQAMAYAFHTAGVPVRNMMVRYNGGINDDDIFSTSFYEDHGIAVDVVELDIISFHETELRDWAILYRNNSPHLLSHCKIASMVTEGTVVSSGAIVTRRKTGDMTYSVFGLERYARISRQSVVGFFFSYCPHLVYATRDLCGDGETLYDEKVSIYQSAGFPVIPQPTGKRHGFEKLKLMYDDHEISSQQRLRYRGQPSTRPYDLLFRYPLVETIPYTEAVETIF